MPAPELRYESGWLGSFTREQASGAYPNGTKIIKTLIEPGDMHPMGSLGTVLGSVQLPAPLDLGGGHTARYGYFVEWDATPRLAVFVAEVKIRLWKEA